jgi:hypothetical protein
LDGNPGGQWVTSAWKSTNSFLADQFLFGSSYPFRPIRQTIDDFLKLGLNQTALEKALYTNASRLMKCNA